MSNDSSNNWDNNNNKMLDLSQWQTDNAYAQKPEIIAQGIMGFPVGNSEERKLTKGTSYSSPIVAGFAASIVSESKYTLHS